MSKKDYQALARAIYKGRCEDRIWNDDSQNIGICAVTRHIADALEASNPRFDRARFIEACETGACKGMRKATAA